MYAWTINYLDKVVIFENKNSFIDWPNAKIGIPLTKSKHFHDPTYRIYLLVLEIKRSILNPMSCMRTFSEMHKLLVPEIWGHIHNMNNTNFKYNAISDIQASRWVDLAKETSNCIWKYNMFIGVIFL